MDDDTKPDCWLYSLYRLTFPCQSHWGLWRSSYLDTSPSLRVPCIFCSLVNSEIIIFLYSEQGQQLCPGSLPGKMPLEALLGKAGHVFPTNASGGSCHLVLHHWILSVLRLASAGPSLSVLGTFLQSYANQSKRLIRPVDKPRLIHVFQLSIPGRAAL